MKDLFSRKQRRSASGEVYENSRIQRPNGPRCLPLETWTQVDLPCEFYDANSL